MREHIVALCYILLISGVCFALMFRPMTARLMTVTDFKRRAGLWLAVTVITFLAHSFWVALLATALLIAIVSRRESNPMALYAVLLFAVPQYSMQVPALGLVNYLVDIDHPRMLALVILLPAALLVAQQRRAPNPALAIADTLFVTFFLYVLVLHATADSITLLMRRVLYLLLDHWLPYYVLTRAVTDRRRFYDVLASLSMALVVLATIGVFENVRSWLVYESLRVPLGVPLAEFGAYLLRVAEDGAYLRAYATMGHAIAFGYFVAMALIFQIALLPYYGRRPWALALLAVLGAGLLASVSRGPWLGFAVAMALGLSFGPGAKRRVAWMLGLLPLAVAALLLLPQGQKFLDLLPFIGTVEAANVSYRTQLLDRAMIVFWQNPIFGSLGYIDNPVLEEMRQGQGIIDIVNSYVGVGLAYGGVGLLLFVAVAGWALWSCLAARHRLARKDPSAELAGRAVATALVASLLIIVTASFAFHIPIGHWLLVSLCVSYAAWAPHWRAVEAHAVADAPAATSRAPAAGRPAWRRT
jgi:O-antigen ligase